jgi:hypothetical protein
MNEPQRDNELLDDLRHRLGISTERKKIIVGTYGKDQTPEERAQAEFEFLSKGGADYSGQQAFREAMRRLGR